MDPMERLAMFNPRPQIERVRLLNDRFCYVIDDALVDPDALVRLAAANRAAFSPVNFSAYPGNYLEMPAAIATRLDAFFVEHLRREFDARRTLEVRCRLSMVTLPPSALRPFQTICHADGQHLDPRRHSIQASVLYLFEDESLGGTSFYEPARSAEETALLFRDANTLEAAAFTQKYGIAQDYLRASNDCFTQVGRVAAKWNRIVFYDGSMLHSGDIFAPEKLSDDPRAGRLTLNGFFASRRNAA
ncbi:MAG: DUF6445 family protein [Rudaea sp.]|uniref:DUF6445 family protein n=1 Tax=Rudaea sp. TaxID=2136325 RepID=UPI0039E34594